ncbi:hypothetical protein SE17_01840 [Kouleothrix aurantiaca]|jgi:copper transport protein|uniref:Copper resistance protein CopC n=1 Tax=Kouleothrix aurantiaca TaxID=186479 RepID=A0A0P9FNC8_9CHLR|nr:hypothetical protein SE17_01840 [Kouleothrix aurantiaca]
MRNRGRVFAIALILALIFTRRVEAHATLVRSEPPAGATLDAAPKELVLEFSEDLDPGFSTVQLLNSSNAVVNPGPGVIDPSQPRILRLALADLSKGGYTAIARVRSVDGHVTESSVPFGVGVAVTATSLIPPAGAPDPATLPPPPLDAASRWLTLLLAAVAFGGLPFGLLVWRPAFRAMEREKVDPSTDEAVTRAIRRLIVIGGALFVLANLLFFIVQASVAANVPFAQAIGTPALQLLRGRSGLLWLARISLALLIMLISWHAPPIGQGTAWRWWIALVLSSVALLTFSLSGHSAALPDGATIAVALDWLHIMAMVAWLGGLVPLFWAILIARGTSERVLSLRPIIPRFSRLAMICVAVLALTGVYSYLQQINNLDLLEATTYGRAFGLKLGLSGLLLVLGAINMFYLSPRLRARGNHLARAFGRSVRLELVAGALLLLAVGVMTSVAPAKTAWEEHERQGLAQSATVENVDLVLRVAPAQIGDNEFAVDVSDKRPDAAGRPAKVLLRFDMQGMQMQPLQIEAQTADTQRYTARGSYTSMGGRWHIEVVLRRAGFQDVRHTFEMDIVRAATVASQ